jgi:hypothetical protein
MSELVFLEGSRDVSVSLEGSYGEGLVWLRQIGDADPRPFTGRISLEGSWVHVKSDDADVTLPQWQVQSIDWTGDGRQWP